MTKEEKVEVMIQVAMGFLGRPYVWGGDDPVQGFDCSGLVVECLKSVGQLPREGDWTAEDLWQMFKGSMSSTPRRGHLVLWQSVEWKRMIHVELCLNDEISIGASGGGSATLTMADAIRQNAYIKLRPFRTRSREGLRRYVDPLMEEGIGNERV